MFRNKKRILLVSLLLIVVIIIVIVVSSIILSSPKKLSYEALENKLVSAAKNYYKANKKMLPKQDGDEISITIKQLVSKEYIKPLEELVENGNKCNGDVTVKNVNNNYSYIAHINCGNDYRTIELYDKILDDNETVVSGKGLYVQNDEYIFRGEVENNYLKVGKSLYRIMGINKDGNIKILYASESERSAYDDRYNSEKNNNNGKNDYKISRLLDNLNEFIENEEIFPTDFKAKLVKINACISPKSETDEDNSMDKACNDVLDNQYATLITLSEYINASIDPECKSSKDFECQNYNYLSKFEDTSNWWTITPNSSNTYQAYQISYTGNIIVSSCSSRAMMRPIFYLSNDTIYKGGDGTIDDPYIILPELESKDKK